MFASATSISIGDGSTALFWFDAWLHGLAPRDLAPSLFAISSRKRRTVAAALQGDAWLQDLSVSFCDDMLEELISLSSRLEHVSLQLGIKDSITWKLASDGVYSARSAYQMLFSGQVKSQFPEFIWKVKAPLKCKFFVWTVVQHRIATSDHLLLRGIVNEYFCPLCHRNLETVDHLLRECPWSVILWDSIASRARFPSFKPSTWKAGSSRTDWLIHLSDIMSVCARRSARALSLLVCWEIWRERNRRIFVKKELSVPSVLVLIADEASIWRLAGCSVQFDRG
ncbi:hypothetical protein D1007_01308 [Hordeum vulgare]|nr:hypothetical protein D1007_01308 [Hordeum vulgare]